MGRAVIQQVAEVVSRIDTNGAVFELAKGERATSKVSDLAQKNTLA